ncbi:hypothetical protein DLAC_11712 [Tieghemostelium lacteum]|uniref:Ankyrin repeat-containing protein n=1 Tax=Tieghemostelium lacteum TaxID=361077 RepID=A0A151ZBD2_TIELA|nr:hypothetical protein DLAC_11712 [Tieghemostelium lacteum]|eukprot:KYQ91257.1 hypothetical protein DLAC_11712 [Tieghemostelium lacteum]
MSINFNNENLNEFFSNCTDEELFKMVYEKYKDRFPQYMYSVPVQNLDWMCKNGYLNYTISYFSHRYQRDQASVLKYTIKNHPEMLVDIDLGSALNGFLNYTPVLNSLVEHVYETVITILRHMKSLGFKYVDSTRMLSKLIEYLVVNGNINDFKDILGNYPYQSEIIEIDLNYYSIIPLVPRQFEMLKYLVENPQRYKITKWTFNSLASYPTSEALLYVQNQIFGGNFEQMMNKIGKKHLETSVVYSSVLEYVLEHKEYNCSIPIELVLKSSIPLDLIIKINERKLLYMYRDDALRRCKTKDELLYLVKKGRFRFNDKFINTQPLDDFFNNGDVELLKILFETLTNETLIYCVRNNYFEAVKFFLKNMKKQAIDSVLPSLYRVASGSFGMQYILFKIKPLEYHNQCKQYLLTSLIYSGSHQMIDFLLKYNYKVNSGPLFVVLTKSLNAIVMDGTFERILEIILYHIQKNNDIRQLHPDTITLTKYLKIKPSVINNLKLLYTLDLKPNDIELGLLIANCDYSTICSLMNAGYLTLDRLLHCCHNVTLTTTTTIEYFVNKLNSKKLQDHAYLFLLTAQVKKCSKSNQNPLDTIIKYNYKCDNENLNEFLTHTIVLDLKYFYDDQEDFFSEPYKSFLKQYQFLSK